MANQDRDLSRIGSKERNTQSQGRSGGKAKRLKLNQSVKSNGLRGGGINRATQGKS
jgi:hypothetical protein